eukprot:SAG31_NODE_186_length_20918_cov_26.890917_18_plen_68_part_00
MSQGDVKIEVHEGEGREIALCTTAIDEFLYGLDVAVRKLRVGVRRMQPVHTVFSVVSIQRNSGQSET